jgi:hypothetical protein
MADPIVRAALLAGAAAWCIPLSAWPQTTESLSIAGVPPTTVQAGQTYTFAPSAVATGPLSPHFEIQNLPPWASFSWAGRITGTPEVTDQGTYSNIVISIVAAPATISWMPPVTNVDGSVLTDLAGYRIYVGRTPNQLVPILALDNAAATSYLLEGLSTGLNYFAMTAMNSRGMESTLSAVVGVTLY